MCCVWIEVKSTWDASMYVLDGVLTLWIPRGWSYGSMVAQLTVQQRPDLVSGVVLFGYPYRPGSQSSEPRDYPDDPPRTPTTAEAAVSRKREPGASLRSFSTTRG